MTWIILVGFLEAQFLMLPNRASLNNVRLSEVEFSFLRPLLRPHENLTPQKDALHLKEISDIFAFLDNYLLVASQLHMQWFFFGSVQPGVHEERKIIKVVAQAAKYGGGWSMFPDITRQSAALQTLIFLPKTFSIPSIIIPQNFSLSGLVVYEELGNKQTTTQTHSLTFYCFNRVIKKFS